MRAAVRRWVASGQVHASTPQFPEENHTELSFRSSKFNTGLQASRRAVHRSLSRTWFTARSMSESGQSLSLLTKASIFQLFLLGHWYTYIWLNGLQRFGNIIPIWTGPIELLLNHRWRNRWRMRWIFKWALPRMYKGHKNKLNVDLGRRWMVWSLEAEKMCDDLSFVELSRWMCLDFQGWDIRRCACYISST